MLKKDREDLKFSINIQVSPKTANASPGQFSALGQKRLKKTAFMIKRRTAGSKTQQHSSRQTRRKIGVFLNDSPV